MKTLFLILTIASLSFASCSKDEDKDPGNFDYDKELLYGTWRIVECMGITWPYQTTTATFRPDGTYHGQGYFGTGSGTYKLSGSRITCYVDGEKCMWYDVISLSGTTCNLVAYDDSGNIKITCIKQ